MAEAFPEDSTYRLLLVGVTGSGKSSTGNSILGKDVFKRKVGMKSGTQECQLEFAVRDNIRYEVVDTPGFCEHKRENKDISRIIAKFLSAMSPGPHAVLVVMKASERFSTDVDTAYKEAKKMLGGQGLANHIVLVFTGGDVLDEEKLDIKSEVEASKEDLKEMMRDAKDRYVLFNNKADEEEKKKEQLDKLIAEVKKVRKENTILTNASQDIINKIVNDKSKKESKNENINLKEANYKIRKEMTEKDDSKSAEEAAKAVELQTKKVDVQVKLCSVL